MRQSGSEPVFDAAYWPVVGNNCYDYAFGDRRRFRNEKSNPGTRSHVGDANFLFKTCGKGMNSMNYRIKKDNPLTVKVLKDVNTPCEKGWYKVMSFVAPLNDDHDSYGDFHFYKQIGSVRYRLEKGDTVHSLSKFFRVKPNVIKEAMRHSLRAKSRYDGYIDQDDDIHTTSKIHSKYLDKVITFPVNLWAHKLGWGTRPLLVDASGMTITDPRKADRNYSFHYNTLCGGYCVRAGRAKTSNS